MAGRILSGSWHTSRGIAHHEDIHIASTTGTWLCAGCFSPWAQKVPDEDRGDRIGRPELFEPDHAHIYEIQGKVERDDDHDAIADAPPV